MATANGYKRRGGLWRSGANYIAVRRDSNDGPFIAQQTAYETGARIADVELSPSHV